MADSSQKNEANEKPQVSKDNAPKDVAEAADEVQKVVDQETEQGFRGVEVDMTPNENYTVEGVLAGKDVPEAHADKVAASREATNPDVR
jgi:hypothetical protein